MPGHKPPESFNFRQPSAWPTWKERFARYRLASKLHNDDEDVQVSSLIYCMGSEAEKIFRQFGLNAADQNRYNVVLQRFDEYFLPRRNVIHERSNFHRRDQKVGESIEEYTRELFELADLGNFPDKEATIRDRLVLGVRDRELSQKMQLEQDLTLDNAIKLARQHELVSHQLMMQREDTVTERVDAASRSSSRLTHRHKTKFFARKRVRQTISYRTLRQGQ